MHEERRGTSAYDPGVHASHADMPVLLWAAPTSHATHACEPVVFW